MRSPPAPEQSAEGRQRVDPAIVTAVISAGAILLIFVTAVGGATLAAQLRGVGLSGSDGVSLISRGRLLTSGADAMLPVLFVTGFAVALYYATASQQTPRRIMLSLGTLMLGLAFYVWKAGLPDTLANGLYLALMIIVLALAVWTIWTALTPGRRGRDGVLALALVILLYGALATYFAHLSRPEAPPTAILTRDGSVILRLWIGQDSNWVYVGEVKPGTARSGQIVAIRQDSVVASAVGVPSPVGEAPAREYRLGLNLCSRLKVWCKP
jgi:hypothetical protein